MIIVWKLSFLFLDQLELALDYMYLAVAARPVGTAAFIVEICSVTIIGNQS